jgi:uncharacterized protein
VSIELLPLGKKCNISCTYCYQSSERIASSNTAPPYDIDAMKQALLAEGVGNGTGFSLFGGEALLFPINDMRHMVEWAHSIGAPVGVQTNGALITDRHIELFKQFKMSVGVSIDGPDDLNDARQAIDPKATRATTAKSIANLERLLAEGISTSLITTITQINVTTDERLGRLIAWMLDLRDKGLRYVNLHTLEPHGEDLSLTSERQTEVLRRLRRELVGFTHVSPFGDMRKALLQERGSNCIWNFCDPYTTPAVRGVDGQGARGNCGRTNTDGVAYEKANAGGHERHLALYLTPQEHGGCAECRFFVPCGGGNCPGEGIGGDWRQRTVHCETIKALLGDIEHEVFLEGKEPISTSLRRPGLEAQLIAKWTGKPTLVQSNREHGDAPHGDRPHGDGHGDHTDHGQLKYPIKLGSIAILGHGDEPHTDQGNTAESHQDVAHNDWVEVA